MKILSFSGAGISLPVVGGAAALVVTAAVVTSTMLSFMSDIIVGNASFTASVPPAAQDTLDISGAYRVYLNGSLTPEATNSVELTPGDVAVVKATITNNGNASAWVQDHVVTSASNSEFIQGSPGVHTAEDFETGIVFDNRYIGAGATAGPPYGGGWSSKPIVLNGTGAGAQVETESNAPGTLIADVANGYNSSMFVNSNTFEVAFSFYFDPEVVGVHDDDTFTLVAKTQAFQYRGNNSVMPITTCTTDEPPVCTSLWQNVVISSIGL